MFTDKRLSDSSMVKNINFKKKKAYLYGITDTKAPVLRKVKKVIQRPLDTYKFKMLPQFIGKRKLIKTGVPLRFQCTPDTLVELSGIALTKLQLPYAFNWTCIDVVGWIDKIGFPQYRNTFYQNSINGRALIFIDAGVLSAINIKDFSHIKTITKSINELYGIEMVQLIRSISIPPRYPLTCFRFYQAFTGPKYHFTKISELFRKMKMLRPSPTYDEHWPILEKYLKRNRPTDIEKLGYAYRNKLYKVRKELFKVEVRPKQETDCFEDILFNTSMTPHETRKHWNLSYLKKYDSVLFKDSDDDLRLIGCTCPEKMVNCSCGMYCICSSTSIKPFDNAPKTMEVLRKYIFKRYEVIESLYSLS